MRTVLGVTILWVLFSAFQNGEYASLSAAIPDHVPVRQRATVAGWVGMPQALGLVVGTVLVVAVFTRADQRLRGARGADGRAGAPVRAAHAGLPAGGRAQQAVLLAAAGRSYWISPREYPDFAWAWFTRFLMSLAIAMGTLYLLYFLRDKIHYARLFPGQDAAGRAADPDRDLHGRRGDHRHRRRDDLRPARPPEDDGPDFRHRDRRGRAAAHVRGDLDRLDRRRGPVRRRLRRLPGRGPGADHPGAADRQGPGQGPRSDQHRPGLPGGHRGADRRAAGVAGRLPDAVRWHRGVAVLGSVLVWKIKSVP